jgi:hypothetical protein
MRRREMYPTLTRMTTSLRVLRQFCIRIMHQYGWSKMKLLYSRNAKGQGPPRFFHFATEAVLYDRKDSMQDRNATNTTISTPLDIVHYRLPETETAILLADISRKSILEAEIGTYASTLATNLTSTQFNCVLSITFIIMYTLYNIIVAPRRII